MKRSSVKIKVHNPNNLQTVSYTDLEDLQGDFKTLSSDAAKKLKTSIMRHGIFIPKFVWKSGKKLYCLDGHQTKKVLASIEEDGNEVPDIPVIFIQAKNRQDAIEKLFVINSRYGKINTQTTLLDDFDWDIDLDIEIEIPELNIDFLLGHQETKDDDILPDNIKSMTNIGDLWELGEHKLICDDATKTGLNGSFANMILTDPPYNVNYSSKNELLNLYAKGYKVQTPIKNDSVDPREYQEFCRSWFNNLSIHLADYNSIYIFGNYESLIKYYELKGLRISNMLVWVKNNIIFGRQNYKGQHEFILYGWFKKHKWYGPKNASTVIMHDKPQSSPLHPTMKPVELLERLIFNSSKREEVVLDPFLGSGSTLIACEKADRRCLGMEIEPLYCDITVYRYAEWCRNNNREFSIKKNGSIIDIPVMQSIY